MIRGLATIFTHIKLKSKNKGIAIKANKEAEKQKIRKLEMLIL